MPLCAGGLFQGLLWLQSEHFGFEIHRVATATHSRKNLTPDRRPRQKETHFPTPVFQMRTVSWEPSWLFKQPQFAEIIWRWDLRQYLTYMGLYGHDLMKGSHLYSNMKTLIGVQIRATLSVYKGKTSPQGRSRPIKKCARWQLPRLC